MKDNLQTASEIKDRVDFDDENRAAVAQEYENLARKFILGYESFYVLTEILLAENLPERAEVLIVGAGGGKEIVTFGNAFPNANFTGVDPSEKMLAVAQQKADVENLASRLSLVRGTIQDVDEKQFDAATALLVMHFLPDDGEKLEFLKAVHRRLKPNTKFIIAGGCLDKTGAEFDWMMNAYQNHARRNGAPPEIVAEAAKTIREKVYFVPERRELELLQAAGFGEIRRFFQGLWFTAWVAEKI